MIRAPDTGELWGWGVIYGEHGEHRAMFLDRSNAERAAANMRGMLVELYVGPFLGAHVGARREALHCAGGVEQPGSSLGP